MSYLGDRSLGSTVNLKFSTRLYGIPTALSGSPFVAIYKSGSSTPISAGVTLTQGYDSTVGLNDVSIITSTGNGFLESEDYQIVLKSATLGSFSVDGSVIGEFSIGATSTSVNVIEIAGSALAASNLSETARGVGRGVVASGATLVSIPTSTFDPAGVDVDQFVGRGILFDRDTATPGLRGETATIGGSSGAASPTFIVTRLTTIPQIGDSFSVI